MGKARLGTRNLSIPQKIQQYRQIVTKMTGNPTFPKPEPTLAVVTAATDKLETDFNKAQGERKTAEIGTNLQNASETALDGLGSALAGHVDSIAKGDDAKILSAGMSPSAAATPVGPLPAPANFSASSGDKEGEVDLHWNPVHGAASYSIYKSTTGNVANAGDWTPAGSGTKSKTTIAGFTSGARVWFRVAALGSAGQGPWSDPATAIAA